MPQSERFKTAIEKFDQANGEDPRKDNVGGVERPRELLFARQVYAWVERLWDAPSEALLLAARSHTLRRWAIPRDRHPMTTEGYHLWRRELALFHAEEAQKILEEVGYDQEMIERVRDLITKANWPADPEALALEDADCLVFLETKLRRFVDEWDSAKMQRVLGQTYQKMTPQARCLVSTLNLGKREREIIEAAVSDLPSS